MRISVVAVVYLALSSSWARADDPPTIEVAAAATRTVAPSQIELKVLVEGSGAEQPAAVADLENRCKSVATRLGELGFDVETVTSGAMSVVEPARTSSRADIIARFAGRMGGDPRKVAPREDPAGKAPAPLRLSRSFTIRRSLEARAPQDDVLDAHRLRTALNGADLVKLLKPENAAAAAEEPPEVAMRREMMEMETGERQDTGPIQLVFLAPITEELRVAVLREALDKAKLQAAAVATAMGATGVRVAKVVMLDATEPEMYMYRRRAIEAPRPIDNMLNGSTAELVFRVQARVTYVVVP